MAVLSAQDFDRFTPPHRADDPAPPVYLVAPMTWRERARWRAELARGGAARFSTAEQIARAVRDAVEEVAPDNLAECLDAVDAMLGLIAAEAARGTDAPADPAPDGAAGPAQDAGRRAVVDAYQTVEGAMAAHPRVAGMMAENAMFNAVAPVLAAAVALRGWEGVAASFERRNGMVPDDVLDRLDERDLYAVGNRALQLMRVSETDRKN